MRSGTIILSAISTICLTTGCQNAMRNQNVGLHSQNRELQERVRQLEAELTKRPNTQQVEQMQVALGERDQKIAELQQQLRTPVASADPTPGIEGIETEFNNNTGEMIVRVPGDVLFDAGVASLKPGSKATLDKISAAIRNDYSGKAIRIIGHTDSDPLMKTRPQWQDNRNLSMQRALAVTRYLESKGIVPQLITTAGQGEYAPRGKDKAKNRRVEIVVVTR